MLHGIGHSLALICQPLGINNLKMRGVDLKPFNLLILILFCCNLYSCVLLGGLGGMAMDSMENDYKEISFSQIQDISLNDEIKIIAKGNIFEGEFRGLYGPSNSKQNTASDSLILDHGYIAISVKNSVNNIPIQKVYKIWVYKNSHKFLVSGLIIGAITDLLVLYIIGPSSVPGPHLRFNN